MNIDEADEILRNVGLQSGKTITSELVAEAQLVNSQALTQSSTRARGASFQSGTTVSILVVLLGCGLMSYLNNSYPKVER